jgi:putative transposase
VYEFVEREKADFPIAMACQVLGVSPSGYYAWRRRPPSARAEADAALSERIAEIHQNSRETYGSPRIHAELHEQGVRCSAKRVARLMRQSGIQGCHRRRAVRTTQRADPVDEVADLVQRNFTASAPNRLWAADITYVPTLAGFFFLAVVLDVFSRRVIGWAMGSRATYQLVLSALEMAIWTRKADAGVIHHSDHGSQYTALAYGQRMREAGLVPSRGSVGDAYDNAVVEAFFATLECELIDRHVWRNRQEGERAIFDFVEAFYNRRRRHSTLGYLSPAEFERRYESGAVA